MHRIKSLCAICFFPLFVGSATLSSSFSYGFTDTQFESNWAQVYIDSLPLIPGQAKKPGWAKPKAKTKTKKNISTNSASSTAKPRSTLSKRTSNLRITTLKGASSKMPIPSSAARILNKNVKATAKLLAKRDLTPARKQHAKTQLRAAVNFSKKANGNSSKVGARSRVYPTTRVRTAAMGGEKPAGISSTGKGISGGPRPGHLSGKFGKKALGAPDLKGEFDAKRGPLFNPKSGGNSGKPELVLRLKGPTSSPK